MQSVLYDYQLEAVEKMKNGCILCGGVGTGKSRTGIGYYFKEQGGCLAPFAPMPKKVQDLYIITTAKKRDSNEWEIDLSPYLLSSSKELNCYENKVIIDSWNNIKKYEKITNAFFIFDEQRVVGYGSWAKSFLKITKQNNWILLTATPGDTWSDYIPVFIANGFYKNKTHFTNEHAIYAPYLDYYKIVKYTNQSKLLKYRNSILVIMKYKKKTERIKTEIPVFFDKAKYELALKDRWDADNKKAIENISQLCYILRKIVNSDESRKIEFLKLTQKHDRIIVFYNFDYELEILRNLEYDPEFVLAEWNGHRHEELPKTKKWLYFVQYLSGSEGWNCIDTNVIVFFSKNYSYRIMQQASGRIDRLNTPFDKLYYYSFTTNSSIDIGINRALRKKENFNESMFFRSDKIRTNYHYSNERE